MEDHLRVFIGYDSREAVASSVCAYSILETCSKPVSITFLKLSQLPMTRERDPNQSTEFAFSRFLVPYLSGYKGFSLFLDCDMLVRADISELFDGDQSKAVKVVKHDYSPLGETKFLAQKQTAYAKKNWSSVMLFNNELCPVLTPEYVNQASGLDLHQFKWLGSENLIGELSPDWNHLVGEYKPNEKAKIVHFTIGGPWFGAFRRCEYSNEWFECKNRMLSYDKISEYLGKAA